MILVRVALVYTGALQINEVDTTGEMFRSPSPESDNCYDIFAMELSKSDGSHKEPVLNESSSLNNNEDDITARIDFGLPWVLFLLLC